jgi:hypothetical protein
LHVFSHFRIFRILIANSLAACVRRCLVDVVTGKFQPEAGAADCYFCASGRFSSLDFAACTAVQEVATSVPTPSPPTPLPPTAGEAGEAAGATAAPGVSKGANVSSAAPEGAGGVAPSPSPGPEGPVADDDEGASAGTGADGAGADQAGGAGSADDAAGASTHAHDWTSEPAHFIMVVLVAAGVGWAFLLALLTGARRLNRRFGDAAAMDRTLYSHDVVSEMPMLGGAGGRGRVRGYSAVASDMHAPNALQDTDAFGAGTSNVLEDEEAADSNMILI